MKGHEVRSAIVRDPSTQAINVTPHGIEGHESAAHNAQVCSLFAHHYDHWTQKLGIPRSVLEISLSHGVTKQSLA